VQDFLINQRFAATSIEGLSTMSAESATSCAICRRLGEIAGSVTYGKMQCRRGEIDNELSRAIIDAGQGRHDRGRLATSLGTRRRKRGAEHGAYADRGQPDPALATPAQKGGKQTGR
jgi:hypothetical protein